MKKGIVLLVFVFALFWQQALRAQYVTIPDAAFANVLQQLHPQCMSGNQLDTICAGLLPNTLLNIGNKGIHDLSGVEYFDNVDTLWCGGNYLTSIEKLPPNIEWLFAHNNDISTIAHFPNSLLYILLSDNNLDSLPELPSGLILLIVSTNNIDSLPELPQTLETLSAYENNLSSLPPLPQSLRSLNIRENLFTSMPVLPDSLETFIIDDNNIGHIDPLPITLLRLECDNTGIDSLPTLPPNLYWLSCDENNLTQLPAFPATLEMIEVIDNQLTSLPPIVHCQSLRDFRFSNNNVSVMPDMPASLINLYCYNNNLTSLPELPASMLQLWASRNNLTSIPELPGYMERLYLSGNPITCLPYLPDIDNLTFNSTYVTCIPNNNSNVSSSPDLSTLPLCDPFDTAGCEAHYNFAGRVYVDRDTNCVNDASDSPVRSVKVELWQNGQIIQQVFTDGRGYYSLDVQSAFGTYEIRLDSTFPMSTLCPDTGFYTATVSVQDSFFTELDFGVPCNSSIDLGVFDIVRSVGWFRPASFHTVTISAGDFSSQYGTSCFSGSGEVMAILSGSGTIQSFGALQPSSVNGDTIVWVVPNFDTIQYLSDFSVDIQVDTFAQFGESVCFEVFVESYLSDSNLVNNELTRCFPILSSYDPNDKQAFPSGEINTTQEWMYYTIRFQNTGSAPAQHIYILDTLSSVIDPTTLELMSASHDNMTQVLPGGIVKFNFPYIELPDSTNDEPNSHGYVNYRVKLKDYLPLGTVIENTAHIYFDFNPAIVTNTTQNTFTLGMGGSSLLFTVNPTATTCGLDNGSIVVTVTSGAGGYEYSLDGSNWQAGNTFTGLAAGPYAVIVRDNSTQQISQATVVGASSGVVLDSVTAVEDTCSRSIGILTVHASGGAGSMQYSINGGITWQSSPVFTGLFSGYAYRIDVRDSAGCTAVTNGLQTGSYNGQVHNFNVTSTNTSCGFQNGTIAFHPPAGAGPFEYSVVTNVWVTDSLFENLPAGSYDCRVRYPFGCAAMLPQFIQIQSSLPVDTFATSVNNATCGLDNAVLAYTAYNGLGNISLDSGQTFLQPYVYNLAPGNYNYIVRDPWGCLSNLVPITIPADPAVHIDSVLVTDLYTCGPNGGLDIYVSGIPGPYTYRILDGISIDSSTTSMNANFTYTAPYSGNYTVLVSDNTGCTDTLSNLAITTLTGLVADSAVVTNTTCGNSNGTATVYARSLNGNPIAVYFLRDSAAMFPSLDTSYTGQYTNLAAGTYYVDIYDTMGCGTSITVRIADVSVTDLTSETQTICQGDSYDGYIATGVYVDTLTSAQGCDSIRTLDLTVLPYITNSVTASICFGGSYQGYTATGTYVDTFATTGCDSIRTLNLTVLPYITNSVTASICSGGNYQGYTATGTYVDTFATTGCDSIRTLDLTVLPYITNSVTASICYGGSYQGYTAAGTYVDTFTTTGCDSVRTLNLTVLLADTINEAITICQGESYNGHDTSGIYVNTYSNAAGCDSTFILDLTVNSAQLSADPVSIISGDSLYVGGAWQTMAGSYSDTLTDASGCDSVVITELTILVGIPVVSTVDFNIYPNPTTGAVTLQLSTVQPTKVSITNTLGQQVYQAEVTGTETLLDLNLQSGVYFVVVETEQGRGVKKLVVE